MSAQKWKDEILDHRHHVLWGKGLSQFSYHAMYRRAPQAVYPELVPKIVNVLKKFRFGYLLQLILGREIVSEAGI